LCNPGYINIRIFGMQDSRDDIAAYEKIIYCTTFINKEKTMETHMASVRILLSKNIAGNV
jgi:hypothetical protein